MSRALQFVIQKSPTEKRYMNYVHGHGIQWETDKANATTFPSKYAAKQRKNLLTYLPHDAIIVAFDTN